MKRFVLLIIVLGLACLLGGTALGGTLNVPSQYPTIQAGIDAADTGDTVLVADDIYTGPGNKNLDFGGKTITVKSENGPENCIIDSEGDGRGFHFHSGEGQASVVSGFTIINGYVEELGGGIYCESSSSPTITNCNISDNTTTDAGGGIACSSSSPIIINCTIIGNLAWMGGGIFNDNSSPAITNCTISEGLAYQGGGMHNQGSSPTLTNCILWHDGAQEGQEIYDDGFSSPVVTFCDVEGGYLGDGNINADPLFVDSNNNDLHLQMDSPCIDAGDNEAASLPPTDFEGDPRVVDGDNDSIAVVDMGADERVPAPDIDVSPLAHDFGDVPVGNSSDPVDITISNHGDADLTVSDISLSDDTNYSLTGETTAILAHGGSHTVAVIFSPTSTGTFDATLTITSNDPDNPSVEVSLTGKGVEPDISIIPTNHDFGSIGVGDVSVQSFTVANTGELDLAIGTVSIEGTHASEFEIQNDYCSGKTVAPTGDCTVDVAFGPTSEGSKSADLFVPSNDPDTPTLDVSLSGEGAPAVYPIITKLQPRSRYPQEIFKIVGSNFGNEQGSSTVHISKDIIGPGSKKIRSWSDQVIKVRVPKYKCQWFGSREFRRKSVWVTVNGADSNMKKLWVFKPDTCP